MMIEDFGGMQAQVWGNIRSDGVLMMVLSDGLKCTEGIEMEKEGYAWLLEIGSTL